MIKFEFESLEELQHVLEAVQMFQAARERLGQPKMPLAEMFVWVYEKTGE